MSDIPADDVLDYDEVSVHSGEEMALDPPEDTLQSTQQNTLQPNTQQADGTSSISSYDPDDHHRSLEGQSRVTYDHRTGELSAEPLTAAVEPEGDPAGNEATQADIKQGHSEATSWTPVQRMQACTGDLGVVHASAGKNQPRSNSVAFVTQELKKAQGGWQSSITRLTSRVNDAAATAASVSTEIKTLMAKIARLENEIRTLRDERANIFYSGSESGEPPVWKTGNKRKGRSPHAPAPTKRAHAVQPSRSDSDHDNNTPIDSQRVSTQQTNIPLEQRISSPGRHEDSGLPPPLGLPPALRPSRPSSYQNDSGRGRGASQPSQSKRGESSAPKPWVNPPPLVSALLPPTWSPTYPSNDYDDGYHHESQSQASSFQERNEGRGSSSAGSSHAREAGGGNRGRGKGRVRSDNSHRNDLFPSRNARDTNLPRPFEEPEVAWVDVGSIVWGEKSRDVFWRFCDKIETDNHGPAPRPEYVSNPDKQGHARGRFVAGNFRTVRTSFGKT
ncbi:hypothetical protein DFH07DRAFT_969286 [Mycena maculata]|uniref:Uncharacterized protein n=1 Tax=Mycena maculata TaxID=230809 RepID=A0AAD7HYA1_9AGAR|nr:hypothetical protein DFH07DRAFT_969286 [Mycena maculata]